MKNQVQVILEGSQHLIPEKLAQLSTESATAFTSEEFLASISTKALSEKELDQVAGGYGPRMERYSDPNDKRSFWERVSDMFK